MRNQRGLWAGIAIWLVACAANVETEGTQDVQNPIPANPPTQTPVPQDPGAACGTNHTGGDRFDYQCPHGQFCNSNGHCHAQKPAGQDCTRSGVCASANCDCESGTCGPALPAASTVGHILYDTEHDVLQTLCKMQSAIDPWIEARKQECGMNDALGRAVLDSIAISVDTRCPPAKPYLVQTKCSFTVKQAGYPGCHADANGQFSRDMCSDCDGTSINTGVDDVADYVCTINLQRRAKECPPSTPGGGGGGGPVGGGGGPVQGSCSIILANTDPDYCESCGGIAQYRWDGHTAYAYVGCSLVQ